MTIEDLKNQIPEYAKDIKLNLSALANEETLTPQQLWGCMVACACATGNTDVIRAISADAAAHITPQAQDAARAAAAIMAMNNVYYKFTGMSANPAYKTMPAKLRMNIIANPGVDKGDFELWSLAVSAMNGCKFCVDSHEAQLTTHGIDATKIQCAVRIAAVMAAVASAITMAQAQASSQIAQAA